MMELSTVAQSTRVRAYLERTFLVVNPESARKRPYRPKNLTKQKSVQNSFPILCRESKGGNEQSKESPNPKIWKEKERDIRKDVSLYSRSRIAEKGRTTMVELFENGGQYIILLEAVVLAAMIIPATEAVSGIILSVARLKGTAAALLVAAVSFLAGEYVISTSSMAVIVLLGAPFGIVLLAAIMVALFAASCLRFWELIFRSSSL